MKRRALLQITLSLSLIMVLAHASHAQLVAGTAIADASSPQPVSNHTFSFSGTIPGQLNGALSVTFSIYPDQQSASALWTETQVVQVTSEKYTVMLGSNSATGLPADIFSADQAHWLGVQVNGAEKRFLLVSVPYAMKAVNADQLGGLPFSEYVTAQQLQAALQSAATPGTSTSAKTTLTGPTGQAAAAGTPPQPATDFTDNNSSEVLLVTQQGTGYAIHAVSSAQPEAIFAENSNTIGGTALRGFASYPSGQSIGLLAEVASPDGISAMLNNRAGGKILSLRSNGSEVGSFDSNGLNLLGQVQAGNFVGSGFGLTNIPPIAVGAQTVNFPGAIVQRDGSGSFSAGQISANNFIGNGFGLTNIPPFSVGAQTVNFPGAIVQRDGNGDFSAGQITANNFIGNGFGLTNVPPLAVGAQTVNFPGAIVQRDGSGSFSAGQISANNFIGNGFGLTNIPPFSVGAQTVNFPGAIVQRDGNGDFSAGQITANNFIGNGFGLTNVPPLAVGAQSVNFPGAIVQRDGSGSFSAGGISLTGNADFTAATSTAPIKAVLLINTPASCLASKELLIKTDAPPGQQLFICNAAGNGYVLVGDGTAAGVGSIAAGDGSVAIGGSASAPTISVANGGVTTAKLAANAVTSANIANGSITNAQLAANAVTSVNLAPNAVTSVSIADGTLSPAKITGTAATLGVNTFSGNQIVQGSIASSSIATGPLSATSGLFAGGGDSDSQISIKKSGASAALVVASNGIGTSGPTTAFSATSVEGDAIDAQTTFNYALRATSTNGIGVSATGGNIGLSSTGTSFGVTANGATALAASGTNTGLSASASAVNGVSVTMSTGNSGKFLSGSSSAGQPLVTETFNVDAFGNIFSAGALSVPLSNNSFGTSAGLLARMDASGNVQHTLTTDTSGIIGVAMGNVGVLGKAQIAYSGVVGCAFDTSTVAGDYVVNSSTSAGFCSDGGSAYPVGVQVVGRILRSSTTPSTVPILLSVSNGSLSSINTGAGLTGGPITSSGTISIANGGVTNAMLQNSLINVVPGTGLSGGGAAPLGGSVTLSNTGALSFNGRSGNILAAAGDYSFAQIAGTAGASQLPSATVYNNQSNIFTADQTIQGNLTATGNFNASGSLTANAFSGTSANISGAATSTSSVLAVNDSGVSGSAISVSSTNNPAALFTSSGPTVFMAGKVTGATTVLSSNGDLTLNGSAHASAFSGDGSALTNVSATKIGTLAQADIATNAALSAETTARQNADTAIQSSVASETSARQSADTTLQNNINAEAAARASADSSLQANINSVSSASAQLAVANIFTAKQTLAASTTANASLNVPAGSAPSSPAAGDVWNTGAILQYRDNASTTRSLVSTTQSGGLQLLKLTSSITPSSVASQACTEQSFSVTGISAGDVLLSVLQPSTSSPGTNIAIGGFRVSAANTVAVQFCNVSRNNSTPTAGVYTFAFMR